MMATTPLFIPLKKEYFMAFANGVKTVEYRKAGGRWNSKTCAIGRAVTLSSGYSTGSRLSGVIANYEEKLPQELGTDYVAWAVACNLEPGQKIACIHIADIRPVS